MYIYEGILQFSSERLMSKDGDDYDICVVVLWLPNCADSPMQIIDYYCGPASDNETKRIAEKFCKTLTKQELQELAELQDIL